MLQTGELHPPEEGSTPRSNAQVSPNAGGLLQKVPWDLLWPDFHGLVIVSFPGRAGWQRFLRAA
jgi:hypothetical protein